MTVVPVDVNAQASPEVLPDGRVTFRISAGDGAETVKVTGQFGAEVILKQGESGLWEGSTEAKVAPGIFEYSFKVDGLNVIDGRNPSIKPQRWPGSSVLHVPADPPAPWDLQDIPHGTVHHHDYHSKALGKWRKLVIYTPPAAAGAPLPVLCLAHGYSDNQDTWSTHGKAHCILDALIHSGLAKPMLVVMPDAHAIEPGREAFDHYIVKNTAAFLDELVNDVIPFVENAYLVKKDAAARAFAGLSMGGHHALTVALRKSEVFSQVGAFSSVTPPDEVVAGAAADVRQLNERLQLFWIACGDEDFLFGKNQEMHAKLEKATIAHDYVITAGDDHSWPVWRRYLAMFVPRLFRE